MNNKFFQLAKRLHSSHPCFAEISDQARRTAAGDYGEQDLKYYLEMSGCRDYLHGIRIEAESVFQIDYLIMTRCYGLLIEVKNIAGEIYFDPHARQIFRKNKDEDDVFPDPILQVDLQKKQLQKFLQKHNYPNIPLYGVVVFTNRSGRLLLQHYPDRDRILTAQALPFFLERLEKKYRESHISNTDLAAMRDFLKSSHRPANPDLIARYNIKWGDIIKGVRCPECEAYRMKRVRLLWECGYCKHRSGVAHIIALEEMLTLFSGGLSNKQIQEVLSLHSADAVQKLMNRSKFTRIGKTKNSKYILKKDEWRN
ncbi:nuclease-like protein [Saliterribacillus persicus]|uniref:Nuclease-like protein n=2 Tax=Saliterribacillus persicus TaxID=930114 RepID=A0A368YF29_9BACI|nr:NERD domain-containing protein [Saliterribacillus persicus]RCW77477.1 nuclease-like protein [Saliterribacillus persicus]